MDSTFLIDSDHAYGLVTRLSLIGWIGYVGSTPVYWGSMRQGSIASSTYAAEFYALRTATEEAQNLRYMLRCIGCNVPSDGSCPTKIFGDNLSVILNAQHPAADLSKKHVAISFHVVRETVAAGIIEPYWLRCIYNTSNLMTKQILCLQSREHCDYIHWCHHRNLEKNNY